MKLELKKKDKNTLMELKGKFTKDVPNHNHHRLWESICKLLLTSVTDYFA
jgi:hypothetical protein